MRDKNIVYSMQSDLQLGKIQDGQCTFCAEWNCPLLIPALCNAELCGIRIRKSTNMISQLNSCETRDIYPISNSWDSTSSRRIQYTLPNYTLHDTLESIPSIDIYLLTSFEAKCMHLPPKVRPLNIYSFKTEALILLNSDNAVVN